MSRNRLDEIIEEELRRGRWIYTRPDDEVLVAIAERAFRHGVEQYVKDGIFAKPAPAAAEKCPWTFPARMPCDKPDGHEGGHGPSGTNAPAEEKKPMWEVECARTVRSAKEAARYFDLGLCIRCGGTPAEHDRRRGERRKGEERKQDPVRGIPSVFWFVSARVFGVNPDLRKADRRQK